MGLQRKERVSVMQRIKGVLQRCSRCGLTHDTQGRVDAACRAWDGALKAGSNNITMCWDKLVEEVNR